MFCVVPFVLFVIVLRLVCPMLAVSLSEKLENATALIKSVNKSLKNTGWFIKHAAEDTG
jgi:hypothetical protein